MRLNLAICLVGCLIGTGAASAQTLASFEVASVKRSPPNHGAMYLAPWGSSIFVLKNATFNYLIQLAFGKPPDQIQATVGWMDSDAYDIEAKLPGGAPIANWRAIRDPLQNLLRERFQLRVHSARKQVHGYALVVAKEPLHLKAARAGLNSAYTAPGTVHGENVSLEGVAYLLSRATGTAVIDRTGKSGVYDIDLHFSAGAPDSNLPDLFTAVREQLGLRLESAQIPLDVLVVDHAERNPTAD